MLQVQIQTKEPRTVGLGTITHWLMIANNGIVTETGVVIDVPLAVGVTRAWSVTESRGTVAGLSGASGTGAIHETIDVPMNAYVQITIVDTLPASPPEPYQVTGTATKGSEVDTFSGQAIPKVFGPGTFSAWEKGCADCP